MCVFSQQSSQLLIPSFKKYWKKQNPDIFNTLNMKPQFLINMFEPLHIKKISYQFQTVTKIKSPVCWLPFGLSVPLNKHPHNVFVIVLQYFLNITQSETLYCILFRYILHLIFLPMCATSGMPSEVCHKWHLFRYAHQSEMWQTSRQECYQPSPPL